MSDKPSKPGDLVGHDASGRVRIDRVIPLPWVLGMLMAVIVQAVAGYYQLQQTTEQLREVRARLDGMLAWQSVVQISDAEQRAEIRELRRRIEQLEHLEARK